MGNGLSALPGGGWGPMDKFAPIASRVYCRPFTVSTGGATFAANFICFCPLLVPGGDYLGMAIHIDTAGAAGKVARLGLYADNGAGKPGSLIEAPAATIAVDTTGVKQQAFAAARTLADDTLYWTAFVSDGAPGFYYDNCGKAALGTSLTNFASGQTTYNQAYTYAALPAAATEASLVAGTNFIIGVYT